MRKPYRAWVNQPSTLQPQHAKHGIRGIVVDFGNDDVRFYPVSGPTISFDTKHEWVSPLRGELVK